MPIPLEGARITAGTIGRTTKDLISINRSTHRLLEGIREPDERDFLQWYCDNNPKEKKIFFLFQITLEQEA